MKKVLMVSCEGLGNGGVQTVMMNIVRSLSSDFQFDMVLTTAERRYYDDEFESFGGTIFRFPVPYNRFLSRLERSMRGLRLYFGLRKILSSNHYDVIHCNNEFYAGFCLKAAKEAGIPIRVCHTHIINSSKSKMRKMLHRLCRNIINSNATCRIGCSKEACEALYGPDALSIVVNNPFDSNRFVFRAKEASKAPVFMQIGSFSDNKNQLFSLEIVAEIKKNYPNVLFYMMGSGKGEYPSRIKETITTLGIEENVVLVPHNADAVSLLSKADYLLFPSKREGFGIVTIEAQAVGLKVYASDTIPKTVNCGGVSFLPLEDGAKKWKDTIIKDYEITHGKHKQFDCTPFALEKVMKIYKKIYDCP